MEFSPSSPQNLLPRTHQNSPPPRLSQAYQHAEIPGPWSLSVTVKKLQSESTNGNGRQHDEPAIIRICDVDIVLSSGSVTITQGASGQVVITSTSEIDSVRQETLVEPGVEQPRPSSEISDSQVSIAEIIDTSTIRPHTPLGSSERRPHRPRPLRRARRVAVQSQMQGARLSSAFGLPFLRSPPSAPPPYTPGFWTSTAEETSVMSEIVDEFGVPMI
ncbi:uncharacterized protein CTRU02_208293 [Colletotrichum truncatum]|uniref:Uncharacterized protein n=1 Tax=Colletotrichum truncatum TaxID=5467 RepID=A0ACC3YVV5_COLTU|nr:uncharacterized protein CTRU02_07528 [Colletotrichum truncatum]KAF6791188.1 hypothetical protein CTRU02_07528 [Colletotrichum truncatum]